MVFFIGCIFCACKKEDRIVDESKNVTKESHEQWKKGYDLPIDEQEEKEAENDCRKMMKLYFDIYETADKGAASNVVLDNKTVLEMQRKLKAEEHAVTTTVAYANMENYRNVDDFLKECMEGKVGSVVIYEVHQDGGLARMKFIFDGTDMYVISTIGSWNDNKPGISYISYTRLKEWKYTEKGWFCYELCVPEPPEVTEIVDGSCLIRIKPMPEEHRKISECLVLGLGYQGQNILCSNWNRENMSKLDYNGMVEYLYEMKYGEKFNSEVYTDGVPKKEFESLIMEYLPIKEKQIRKYAAFDEKNQTYLWARLGPLNYTPTFFETSMPEVVGIKENKDGTVTLTVEAVCDMVICDDAFITHELTVRFEEDGSFKYLGNEILDDGIKNIPEYQYRIKE
ncbi:MAG: hypothetical protein E7262_07585 [Lachnospiraceae bacterium]|nr:hypothetical protein [Lachnospiraceae bacterium]